MERVWAASATSRRSLRVAQLATSEATRISVSSATSMTTPSATLQENRSEHDCRACGDVGRCARKPITERARARAVPRCLRVHPALRRSVLAKGITRSARSFRSCIRAHPIRPNKKTPQTQHLELTLLPIPLSQAGVPSRDGYYSRNTCVKKSGVKALGKPRIHPSPPRCRLRHPAAAPAARLFAARARSPSRPASAPPKAHAQP